MAAARLGGIRPDVAEMVFEGTGDAIGLHHQHRDAKGFRPVAPVGGDIAKVVRHEEGDAELRVLMMQFECDRNLAVTVVDCAGRDALEGAGRKRDG